MNASQETDKSLAHQASEWVTVLRSKASHKKLAEFADWVKVSPRNVREFLAMVAIEKELHHVDAERKYGAHELGEDSFNVLALKDAPTRAFTVALRRSQRIERWRVWAVAAAFALIVLTTSLVSWQSGYLGGWRNYATALGEQRAVELADGSIVHLNTHSRMKVRISAELRDIQLLAGEALFKVHRDPARPFRVHTGDAAIQALGTQFNVYRRSTGTSVVVIEGAVRVSRQALEDGGEKVIPLKLAAGEEIRVRPEGRMVKHKSPDPAKAIAWQQRRLVFDQASLADMVREFSRYNKTPQFRLGGAAVEQRHYTGVFDADDPESLVQLLSAEPDLTVTRNEETITVRPR